MSLKNKNIREDMNIVIVGHVDHGKSTIIGRLLADTKTLPIGKLEAIREKCKRNSKPFEYAFLLDALKDEQCQGITIDSARCFFKTEKRNYMIIDAPGHIEFLKNMVTGASRAEAALLVIDAFEGIMENSKRHGYLLSMIGIKQIAVVINKMDLVNYSRECFEKIIEEYRLFLKETGIENATFIPVSAMDGENITKSSDKMSWYRGDSVVEVLDKFKTEKSEEDKPFRMPVQDVYKFTAFGDNRRIVAGSVETGKICVGDEVEFYPSKKSSKIRSIETFNTEPKDKIVCREAAAFTLSEQIYVKRGEIAVKKGEKPPEISAHIGVNIFWLGKKPMIKGKEYYLKLGSAKVKMKLHSINRVLDAATLEVKEKEQVDTNDVAYCTLSLNKEIAFEISTENMALGRFVIVDDYEIAGGGIVLKNLSLHEWISEGNSRESYSYKNEDANIVWHNGKVNYEDRCRVYGQKGVVLWFTGLSGAGKSTIASEVEKELIKLKKLVYRLDGDNVRHGLNSDLGFSKDDRNENIRRLTETALLFKDASFITIVAAISPYSKMRKFARERIGSSSFIEIYVKADIEECIKRDPKGMYAKAKAGKISGFTGIEDPYEEPVNPEIEIDTVNLTPNDAAEMIIEYLEKNKIV